MTPHYIRCVQCPMAVGEWDPEIANYRALLAGMFLGWVRVDGVDVPVALCASCWEVNYARFVEAGPDIRGAAPLVCAPFPRLH